MVRHDIKLANGSLWKISNSTYDVTLPFPTHTKTTLFKSEIFKKELENLNTAPKNLFHRESSECDGYTTSWTELLILLLISVNNSPRLQAHCFTKSLFLRLAVNQSNTTNIRISMGIFIDRVKFRSLLIFSGTFDSRKILV